MIKESIHQEYITNLNVYASKRVSKYIKQKVIELKAETDKSTIIVEEFSTPISITVRKTTQKISKDIGEINNPINQHNLVGIFRTLHPKTTENTFFLSAMEYIPR